MNTTIYKNIISSFLLLVSVVVFAQNSEKIELIKAGSLEGITENGVHYRKLKDNVVFKQGETFMYCDSAFQYVKSNSIDAFGHVRMVQGDSLTLTGNKLNYNGDTKLAKVIGNVNLKDRKMHLFTPQLNYETDTQIGYYFSGGKIIDGKNTLTSKKGSYNSKTDFFGFKDDVLLVNPQYTIDCDTLNYSSKSKIAYFHGPTNINSREGVLFAKDGEYNTLTGESYFSRDAVIENDDYKLIGDKMHYNEKNNTGYAEGNVEMILKEENIIIYADYGSYDERTGLSKSFGNPIMKYVLDNDTMYLKGDTLISEQKNNELIKLRAFKNVEIFKSDLKGKCDSLTYAVSDSTIFFDINPVLWSNSSQLTGVKIKTTMKNNQMDKLFVDKDAFMVSQDSLMNFNQIKGVNMIAHFLDGNMETLDVKQNGESVYFALEEDTALVGLNRTTCENMIIRLDSNVLTDIVFLTNPVAKFMPPQNIEKSDAELPGLVWRKEEEPLFKNFIRK